MITNVILIITGILLGVLVFYTLISTPYDNDDNDDQIL
jgi:hypothetical protein